MRQLRELNAMSSTPHQTFKRTGFDADLPSTPEVDTRAATGRVIFAEGDDKRVLHATYYLLNNSSVTPILVGDTRAVEKTIEEMGLDLNLGRDVKIFPAKDAYEYRDQDIRELLARHHRWDLSSPALLHRAARNTPIAARLVEADVADFMICGMAGRYAWHFTQLTRVLRIGSHDTFGTLHVVHHGERKLFVAQGIDKTTTTPTTVAELSFATAGYLRSLGFEPKIWLCAHLSNVVPEGRCDEVMHTARDILQANSSNLQVMLPRSFEEAVAGDGTQTNAHAFIFSSNEASVLARAALRTATGQDPIGPLLLGLRNKAHIANGEVSAASLAGLAIFAAGCRFGQDG